MTGVSIDFFGAAERSLRKLYGERLMDHSLNAFLHHLAAAERVYAALTKVYPKSKRKRKAT